MRRLPAEWEPQDAILITWPHDKEIWADLFEDINNSFAEIAGLISQFVPIIILCNNSQHQQHINELLPHASIKANNITYLFAPSNDCWIRDYGPITVTQSSENTIGLNFRFNGWGGKHPHELDNRVNLHLQSSPLFKTKEFEAIDLVLEGGSIDSDGCGTLICSAGNLKHPRRNPGHDLTKIEAALCTHLGCKQVLWLKNTYLAGDDTDGHIDLLVRFCTPDTLVYSSCDDPSDKNYLPLKNMEEELSHFTTLEQKPYHLIPLPLPTPQYGKNGERLPSSYTNFLILPKAILVPSFGCSCDTIARKILADLFPDRSAISIDCRTLIHQGGGIHCATMQLPQGSLNL